MEKPKILRVVTITALFPELKGGSCDQTGKGKGSTLKVAASRAIVDLLRQKKLRKKQFSMIKATIAIGKEEVCPDENTCVLGKPESA